MITEDKLRSESAKDLAQMAKSKGVQGWHAMRKEELIKALLRLAKKKATAKKSAAKSSKAAAKPEKSRSATSRTTARTKSGPAKSKATAKRTNPRVVGKIREIQKRRFEAKDIAFFREQMSASEEPKKDRIILFVRDPFWLQAYWEITKDAVERAKVALAEHWHGAQPILRLLENEDEGVTGSTEQPVRDIPIHGGVNNWYIDVKNPPSSYRVQLGYKAANGKFQAISQSNRVRTPVPGSSDDVDHNWTDLSELGDRLYSLSGGFEDGSSVELKEVFEEKLRRPMNRSALSRYGVAGVPGQSELEFVVDAELLVFGQTHPNAQVNIANEPVKLRPDGSFTVRMSLPDRRQVLPVTSSSFDGTQIHTTVLAIERNTKVMEPMSKEPCDDF